MILQNKYNLQLQKLRLVNILDTYVVPFGIVMKLFKYFIEILSLITF